MLQISFALCYNLPMITMKRKFDNLINIAREKTEWFIYSHFFPVLLSIIALLFWVANLQIIGLAIISLIACFVLIVYDDFLPFIPLIFIIPMCFINPSTALSETLLPTVVIFALLILAIVFHFIRYSIKITLDKYFYMLVAVAGIFIIGGLFTFQFKNYFKAIDLFAISVLAPMAIHVFLYNKVKITDKINYRKYFAFCFICATSLASMQLCYTFAYIKLIGPWPYGLMPGGFCWANSNHVTSLILIAVPLCCYMMTSTKKILAWFIELVFLYVTVLLSGSDGGLITLVSFTPFLMCALYKNVYKHHRRLLFNVYFALISVVVLIVAYLFLFRFDNFFAYILDSSSSNGRIYPYTVALENFLKQPILGVGFGNGRDSLDAIVHIHQTNGFFHSTFLHVLACAGIVGVIVYAIYYVVRIKYLAKGNTLLGYFALFSLFMFGVYGMMENNEFNIVLMFMTTVITVVGLMNKKGSDDKPLPLFVRIPKF